VLAALAAAVHPDAGKLLRHWPFGSFTPSHPAPGFGGQRGQDRLCFHARHAPFQARRVAQGGRDRSVARRGGQLFGARGFWGAQTGPNPTDRRKKGSKHHVITDANGTPLACTLTGANRHDITQLLSLVNAVPAIRGKPGRPIQRPKSLYADRAYHSEMHRILLWSKGIEPHIAPRGEPHGSGLGKVRWVVERTISWLHPFRRLRIRFERRADIHKAVLTLGCAMLCWNTLNTGFC
jgi:transposase